MEREDLSELWALATRQLALGLHSLHGPDHWQRVECNALEIAATSGADVRVVRLFAVLHDSKRMNESHDPQHGKRAADWARELRGSHVHLDDAQFNLLSQACIYHDKGHVSDNPTIGTCWDADRLDLPRVGIRVDARYLSTASAKAILVTGKF